MTSTVRPRALNNAKRLHALEQGKKSFIGLPCAKCGQKKRRTSNNTCMKCKSYKVVADRVVNDPHDLANRGEFPQTEGCVWCRSKRLYTRRDGSRWCSQCRAPQVTTLPTYPRPVE